MSRGVKLWAGAGIAALTLSLFLIPTVRARADGWISGFYRDTFGALYVTCEYQGAPQSCQGSGGGAGAPLPGGSSTNVAPNQSIGMQVLNAAGTQLSPLQANSTGGFPVNPQIGATPFPVTTPSSVAINVVSTPLPVVTPAAMPTDGNAHPIVQDYASGQNGSYPMVLPDQPPTIGAAITCTAGCTTLVLTGTSGKKFYIWSLAVRGTVANTASTNFQFVEGTTTTNPCDTNQAAITPQVYLPAAIGAMQFAYSGAGNGTTNTGIVPAAVPIITTAGYNVCVINASAAAIGYTPTVLADQL